MSSYVHVDDTAARHQGRNGCCTHIGNELFAWFESAESKSRINFLKLLRSKHSSYVLSYEALEYMRAQKLKKRRIEKLAAQEPTCLNDEARWKATPGSLDISEQRSRRHPTHRHLQRPTQLRAAVHGLDRHPRPRNAYVIAAACPDLLRSYREG